MSKTSEELLKRNPEWSESQIKLAIRKRKLSIEETTIEILDTIEEKKAELDTLKYGSEAFDPSEIYNLDVEIRLLEKALKYFEQYGKEELEDA